MFRIEAPQLNPIPVHRAVSLVLVGVLAITFTTGVAHAEAPDIPHQAKPESQSVVVNGTTAAAPAVSRDRYTVEAANPIAWPFSDYTVTSGFGARTGCAAGCSTDHHGVDFSVPAGSPIRAVANGTVTAVTHSEDGYGVHVIVAHKHGGVSTLYGHMLAGSPTVAAGQQVSSGQVIGLVGSTGTSTGDHLHLEVRIGGHPVDPAVWLRNNAD